MKVKTIKIGNMCCSRCVSAVKQVFENAGVNCKSVELGFAEIVPDKNTDYKKLEVDLRNAGFEIIVSKEEEISEKIKIEIHILFSETKKINLGGFVLRVFLEDKIQLPYKKIAEIFSIHNHQTIEHYFIINRIEKVKMMIEETDFSFSEIAFKVGFNSLSHLSRQFKFYEGMSMSRYKLIPKKKRKNKRKNIDEI